MPVECKDPVLLQVKNLKKSFDTKVSLINRLKHQAALKVYAVDNVTFDLNKGEILGLIGESGCGKSTTARIILKLLQPDSGEILYKGQDITRLADSALNEYRQKVQIVFQDPYEYLNSRMNVLDTIAEPLVINRLVKNEEEKVEWVCRCLEMVGVSPAKSYLYRYPHEMSGGQRQRIAIARALVMEPDIVVADEPTSMLDVSVRAGVLNVLRDMKKNLNLSMIFITHDLTTAGYMCDKIAVMYKGRVVELGSRDDIIFYGVHPYTKALVNVAFDLKGFLEGHDHIIKSGEVNSYEKIQGCPFKARCVLYDEGCDTNCCETMHEVSPGHYVSCCKV